MKIVSKISDYREKLSPDGNLDAIHTFHDGNRIGTSRQANAKCKVFGGSRAHEADLRI